MGEVHSDERFLELFGNEPYPDFTPDSTNDCANLCKWSYRGVRPLDFRPRDSYNVLSGNEDMDPQDFYGALPGVLVGLVKDIDHKEVDPLVLLSFFCFFDRYNSPDRFWPEGLLRQGYKADQIEYMIRMFESLIPWEWDEEDYPVAPVVIIECCTRNLVTLL